MHFKTELAWRVKFKAAKLARNLLIHVKAALRVVYGLQVLVNVSRALLDVKTVKSRTFRNVTAVLQVTSRKLTANPRKDASNVSTIVLNAAHKVHAKNAKMVTFYQPIKQNVL